MIKTTRLKTSQVPKNITYDLTPQVDGVKQTFELPEKVYDLDQHYVLFNGQVYRNDGNHTFYTISADGMELTTLFDEAPRPGASYVLQFVKTEIAEGDGAASKSYVDEKVADEATARENADIALGQRIDTVIAASDVKDIVGTHADLESYDTSTLGDNDIIKVLADETQSGKISYYRWSTASSQFSLIGSEGPYQMALTPGSNITIDANNEISATDTTYSNFVGTDGVDAGAAGLVPAPATTDADKYLKSDGTWAAVSAGPTIVQTTGTSQTDVMSQVATSQLIYPSGYETTKNRIVIGSGASVAHTTYTNQIAIGVNAKSFSDSAIAIGHGSTASGINPYHWGLIAIGTGANSNSLGGVAIGYAAKSNNQYSTALGTESKTRAQGVVDISTGTNNHGYQGANDQSRTDYRVISGVHDGELATDAATVSQALGTTETYTIADTDWVALSGANPYTYSADVTATATIGANTICELFNDDAVTFATYGFAIGVVNSQTVTIYSVGAPTSSVTLKINYKG